MIIDYTHLKRVDDMKRLTLILTAVSSLFLFAACGQSGPLYVPGNPSTMAVPPSNPESEEQSNEEQDEGDAATAE